MSIEADRDGWSPQGPVTELTEPHAWGLLETQSFGRLGLSSDDRPQIFPVNFAVQNRTILFRTAGGAKLRELIHNKNVAFEADSIADNEAWSVVVRGIASLVVDPDETRAADTLSFPRWVPTLTYVYVRITPNDIRGRRFAYRLRAEREPDANH
jgi:nitroimidazol reductase NimA-like FMN-containing flavoprotein (pyridoxamine 5'-phosphate oxidase superfamily)